VKVKCRDTVHSGSQYLEFFGMHNREVSDSLKVELCSALSTFDPTCTGGRLKR